MDSYYYNVNSSRRVLHLCGCHYLTNARKQEFGEKHSLKKALSRGFSLCKHCFSIRNRFESKYQKFGGAYGRYNYQYICNKECLEITTGKGNWKVLYAEDAPLLELYHQNKEIRNTDSLSRIPGYHDQKVQGYEFSDIFYYIYIHDGRVKHPPAKGTKKYKEIQKRNKIIEKRAAVDRVLQLIDSLHSV